MRDVKELKEALYDITMAESIDVKAEFEAISKALLNDCIITKGKIKYRIREIEFYLMRKDYQDFVTYPRTCNAGDWFFHNSGVDIAFESKCSEPKANPEVDRFGGVLIRTVERLNDHEVFDGPIRVVNEVVDMFNALNPSFDAPRLMVEEGKFQEEFNTPQPRHNVTLDERYKSRYVAGYKFETSNIIENCRYYSLNEVCKAKKDSSYYDLQVNSR